MAKSKITSYKGFKIKETKHELGPLFKVYTKEEWEYGEGFRCPEWEACSMKEAIDFIDSWNEGIQITSNNFLSYNEDTGFRTM